MLYGTGLEEEGKLIIQESEDLFNVSDSGEVSDVNGPVFPSNQV